MKQCPICDTGYPDEHTTCPTDGAVLLEIREWAPGTVIRNKYRILAVLGRGGMGTVYKAEHLALEEVRALKVMATQLASDPKFVRRFRQEAQAARRLRHTNTVHVDDFEQAEDGSLFIAMEYVDGVSLRDLLRATKGPLSLPQALGIARGVAEGLGAAHALGMVHRDIKPENILLERDAQGRDVPKVGDFGIVAIKEVSTTLSQSPLMTPPYASPEQWKGMKANELDGRADLYALGITLYEMLTGRLPFRADSNEGWRRAHLDERPSPPSRFVSQLAAVPGLDRLLLSLLAKDREQRPQNAQIVVKALHLLEARSPWMESTKPAFRSVDSESNAELSFKLREAIEDPAAWLRKAAVEELDSLLRGSDLKLAEAAKAALLRLKEDDSRQVARAAEQCLEAFAANQERQARERADQERRELEKKKEEAECVAKQITEAERLAREREEQERLAQERERVEAERIAKEQAKAERLAREREEQERLAQERERVEAERIAKEQAKAERLTRERAEQERLAQELERVEAERIAKEQAEAERLARERAEQERLAQERERVEAERIAKEQAEVERLTRERAEQERLARKMEQAKGRAKNKAETVPHVANHQRLVRGMLAAGVVLLVLIGSFAYKSLRPPKVATNELSPGAVPSKKQYETPSEASGKQSEPSSLPTSQRTTAEVATSIRTLLEEATSAMDRGNYVKAISTYRKVLRIDPQNKTARDGLERAKRAKAAEEAIQ